MKYILTLSLALSVVGITHGQTMVSIGPRIGLTGGSAPYKSYDYEYDTKYHLGGEAGVMAIVSRGRMALQASVLYSQKGIRVDDLEQDSRVLVHDKFTYSLNYLTLPMSVAYTQHENGQGFQAFAGGYLGVFLNGKYTWDTYTQLLGVPGGTTYKGELDVRADDVVEPEEGGRAVKKLDAGLQAGVGYRYNRLLLQLGYNYGLVNIGAKYRVPGGIGELIDTQYYHRLAQFSVAYLFGKAN